MDDRLSNLSPEPGAPRPVHEPGFPRGNGGAPLRAPRRGPEPAEEPRPGEPAEKAPGRRRPSRRILFGALAVAVVVAGVAYWLHARGYEDTDDARVEGDIVAVSSRVAGNVAAVHVSDNQAVKAGDVLVELDPTDLEVALAQARAAVAQARAAIASGEPGVAITETSNVAELQQARDQVEAARSAEVAAERALDQARASERLARSELERARSLLAGEVLAKADFDQRQTAYELATAAVGTAEKQLQGRQAQLQGALAGERQVERNGPRQLTIRQASVEAERASLALAQARERQAELDLGYAKVTAPTDGIIGRKSVNPGERVQVGQQLMALTATGRLWITADFRETQVRRMRVGQPATVHVDALDRDFHGAVESFPGATGSEYSLLPPENASGNYVKVVQRLQVRIRLDPGQPGLDGLRPGMSVEPSVELR